jgi:hypothetical protein
MSKSYGFLGLSNSLYTTRQSIKYEAISFNNLGLNFYSFVKRSPLKYDSQTVSSGSLVTIIDRNQSEFPTVYGYIL